MSTGSSFSYAVIVFICNSSQTSISTPDLFQEFPVAYFLTPPGCLTNRSEWNYLHSPNSCQPIPPLVLPFNHKWFHDPILLSYLCQISSWDTSLSINYNQIDTTLLLISTIHNLSLSPSWGEGYPNPSLSILGWLHYWATPHSLPLPRWPHTSAQAVPTQTDWLEELPLVQPVGQAIYLF